MAVEGRRWGDERRKAADEMAAARRAVHALGDAALLDAMAADDPWAWDEFVGRFRALCIAHGRPPGASRSEWSAAVDDVLADEAIRLTTAGAKRPRNLGTYLVRAAVNRFNMTRRTDALRERLRESIVDGQAVEQIVRGVCSQYSLESSAGPRGDGESEPGGIDDPDTALRKVARRIAGELTPEQRAHVEWLAREIPQRVIAEWLGIEYEAAAKRGTRLCAGLRRRALALIDSLPPEERRQIARGFVITGDAAAPKRRRGRNDERT